MIHLAIASSSLGGFNNGGTPKNIPLSFDCAVRTAAWEFGKKTLARRGDFKTLFDALQLENGCGVTPPSTRDTWTPPKLPTPAAGAKLYVAPGAAAGGDGSLAKPFATIAEALAKAASVDGATTVLLRTGTHTLSTQQVITTDHSHVAIQNYNGEHATISGGLPLASVNAASAWSPFDVVNASTKWTTSFGVNNVFGRAVSKRSANGVFYLGQQTSLTACEGAAKAHNDGHNAAANAERLAYSLPSHEFREALSINQVTWHHVDFKDPLFAGGCYGTSDSWKPTTEAGIDSAQLTSKGRNVYVATVAEKPRAIRGLRVGGLRGVRAKFPNGNPELSGQWFVSTDPGMGHGEYVKGWITDQSTEWVKPKVHNDTTEIVYTGKDWPAVHWPLTQEGGSTWTGEGDWGEFHIGSGGWCDDIFPPTGYWCAMHPPRGQCYDPVKRTSRGCTQTHMSPDGVTYSSTELPNAQKWSDATASGGAVVQKWRGGGRWFTDLCLVSEHDKSTKTLTFDDKIGCNQGGEGEVGGSQWWVENVKEELDDANEWWYDEKTFKLYFAFNGTEPPSGSLEFVATHTETEVLFNVTGSKANPVIGFTIAGVEIRDAAYTYMGTTAASVHGMPSGGDWGLQRSGAVLFEGTEECAVSHCHINRVDGNGVFISNYNRNATVAYNEFSWIGDSAIASWGSTGFCLNENCTDKMEWRNGPDAREGLQPRGNRIVGNLVREIGIFQKQSSMYFQATSAQTYLAGNVHFNGPRAGLNFNDGMGGGDVLEGNLLANCVRESGDHGPFNSWDRVPYVTDIGMLRDYSSPTGHRPSGGKPSVVPTFRQIRSNFIFDVYSSQEAIDTDDGSSYYHTHKNFMVYAADGLKSDFGGQWNHHYDNVYAYVGRCFGGGNNLMFENNTCVTFGNGYASDCQSNMNVSGNAVANQAGSMVVCSKQDLAKYISEGHDKGSSISKWPKDDALVAAGLKKLAPWPKSASVADASAAIAAAARLE